MNAAHARQKRRQQEHTSRCGNATKFGNLELGPPEPRYQQNTAIVHRNGTVPSANRVHSSVLQEMHSEV